MCKSISSNHIMILQLSVFQKKKCHATKWRWWHLYHAENATDSSKSTATLALKTLMNPIANECMFLIFVTFQELFIVCVIGFEFKLILNALCVSKNVREICWLFSIEIKKHFHHKTYVFIVKSMKWIILLVRKLNFGISFWCWVFQRLIVHKVLQTCLNSF